jgi:ketosteroid isomerase-like protein
MPNSKFAAEFFELINRRSFDQMGDYLTEDSYLYFPKTQPLMGRERILKFFQVLFRQYPELHFEVQRIIAQGESVAMHWTNQGVTRKKEHYENEGVTLFDLRIRRLFLSAIFLRTRRSFHLKTAG